MSLGLVVVGSKESHSRFGEGDCQALFSRPVRDSGGMGGKGTGGSLYVRGGVGVSEVVGIGSSQLGDWGLVDT